MNTPLVVDNEQIRQFAEALLCHADPDCYFSLRSFKDEGNAVFEIKPVSVNDWEKFLAETTAMATRCANHPNPIVFCPPIATFISADKADEAHLANGLALSVECDQMPYAARQKLESILGYATIVVASGGIWGNPETGELEDKLHLHWRLNEPTRTQEEHKLLKEARGLATEFVGGDASNKPVVHPIRWPGSWHRKTTPRMSQIIANSGNEVDLRDAVEKLRETVGATRAKQQNSTEKTETPGENRDTAALVAEIASGRDYHAPITALAMRYLKAGMLDAQVVLTLRGFMQAVPEQLRDIKDGTESPERWQARYDDIPRAVSTAREKIDAEAKDWGEPQPIKVELLPVDPFDADALLPDVLKEWVLDTAGRMPCPPDFVAVAALVALGSVIGARCVVKPKRFDDWVVVPNLWGVIVSPPSVTKKSPAISAALKPLDWLIATAKEEFKEACDAHKIQQMIWEARESALEDSMKQAARAEAKNEGNGYDKTI